MNETIGYVVMGIGVTFNFFGCVGLVRLPDIYNRLQAATKCVTLGTCFTLVGLLIITGFTSMGMKAVVCMIFILMTSPTAAHAIAKGAYRSGVKLWDKSVIDAYEEKAEKDEDEEAQA